MRKNIFLCFVLVIAFLSIFFSCKKKTFKTPINISLLDKSLDSIKYFISGKWKLAKEIGGFSPATTYPNNTYWEFTNDSNFICTKNGVAQVDIINWHKISTPNPGDTFYIAELKNSYVFIDGIVDEIRNDTLIIHDYCNDCYGHYLVRY